jgi:hypothetical protein
MFSNYSLGLILHPLDPRPNGILVAQVPSVQRTEGPLLGNGSHVVVKLVYERRAGGYVQLGDDVLADAVESLHQRAQGIAVGGDDHGLSRFEHGSDVRLEVRRDALEGGLETLRPLVGEVESGVPFVKVGGGGIRVSGGGYERNDETATSTMRLKIEEKIKRCRQTRTHNIDPTREKRRRHLLPSPPSSHLCISPWIVPRMVHARSIHHGGRYVVAPPPDQYLILTVLVDRLLLVQSLERSVMSFVELPSLRHRDPHPIRLLEHVPQRAYRSLLQRREGHVGEESGILNQLARLDDLLVSLGRQGDVDPTGEFVLEVPGRFAVTDQYERVLVCRLEGGEAIYIYIYI